MTSGGLRVAGQQDEQRIVGIDPRMDHGQQLVRLPAGRLAQLVRLIDRQAHGEASGCAVQRPGEALRQKVGLWDFGIDGAADA